MSEPTRQRLPLELVTGFLGSGKTTLINAVLRDPAFAGAMVIVNEFGEVGLDHLLISSAQDQVVLLDSGCLCCAVSGTLRDTLIDLFSRRGSGGVPPFDRLIVETSGLANPAPLVASLLGDSAVTPRVALTQVLTLVDAVNGLDTLARFPEAQRQVAFADRLLVTKTDLATPAQVEAVQAALASLNPQAPIERRQPGDAPAQYFLPDTPASGPASRPAHGMAAWLRGPVRPQYAADAVDASPAPDTHGETFGQVSSHVLRLDGPVTWEGYAAWTDAMRRRFGKRLLRCKGLLAVDADVQPWVVQGVQGYFAPPARLPAGSPLPAGGIGWLICIGESLDRTELDGTLPLLGPASLPERNPVS